LYKVGEPITSQNLKKKILISKEAVLWPKLEEEAKIKVHLDELNRILTELPTLVVMIEKKDKALLLLVSLHASYDHIAAWEGYSCTAR